MSNSIFINAGSISTNKFPCKDCKGRCVGCHGKCEKYLSAKSSYEEEKANMKRAYIINEGDFLGDSGHTKRSRWKKHGRK